MVSVSLRLQAERLQSGRIVVGICSRGLVTTQGPLFKEPSISGDKGQCHVLGTTAD